MKVDRHGRTPDPRDLSPLPEHYQASPLPAHSSADGLQAFAPSQPDSRHIPPTGRPLQRLLLTALLASLVPLFAFTGLIIWNNMAQQFDALRRGMMDTVSALSLAVDRQWGTIQAVLTTLSASTYLDAEDWQAFYDLCVKAASGEPGAWIVLFAPSGQQVINSLRPFGAALPNIFTDSELVPGQIGEVPVANSVMVRHVLATGNSSYSDLFIGRVSQQPSVSMNVPVLRDGRVIYTLAMGLPPKVFTDLLQAHGIPEDWVSVVVDRRDMIIARSRSPEQLVGQPVTFELHADVAAGAAGWGRGRTWEGFPVYHAWTHSPVTGWTTAIAVPEASITGPIKRALALWASGAVLVLALGIGLALQVTRRITAPLTTLARSADLVQRGQPFTMPQGAVREVWDLYRALALAAAERAQAEEALHRLNVELDQRVQERTATLQGELVRRAQVEAELTSALHEKEVLLKEIHHRVKNNLQVIVSLLYLQSTQVKDPAALALFEDTQNRIRAMALIHESLYRTGDLARFNFAHYIARLSTDLLQAYAAGTSHIRLHTDLAEVAFDIDTAVPCGLILNELLTNALKYAFPDGRSGDVNIVLRAEAERVTLSVHDTGIGFPVELDFRRTETLGLQLVSMLTEQLGGTITLTREGGTAFTLTLPYHAER